MADEDRSFDPDPVAANRAQQRGLGAGHAPLDRRRAPARGFSATDPERLDPFDQGLDPTTGGDVPPAEAPGAALDDRNAAGLGVGGDLGAGTPANVDVHNLGQKDRPQEAWGDAADAEATYSANHTRRPIRTEAERGQGAKTRTRNKDIVSRRT